MKTELKNGEHTTFTAKSGTKFWVCNVNGQYHVENSHGSKRKPTAEIMAAIALI